MWTFIFICQNRSSNQRSGIILEVQIQNFGARGAHWRTCVKVFIFKKFQGAQILLFFCENWHEASFYNKEQTQKYKFKIWVLKLFYFYPRKRAFLVFEEKHKKMFSLCFGPDSALKTITHKCYFVRYVWKGPEKKLPPKTPFWPFLKINHFFINFKKYWPK